MRNNLSGTLQSSRRLLAFAALAPLLAGLVSCGGSSPAAPTTPAPTPTPTAAVTATGNGKLVVHPSADSTFKAALETPLRLQETGGGSANWDFARISIIQGGKEIERAELGSDPIRAANAQSIGPKSTTTPTIIFRFNSAKFDDLVLTLGFTDTNSRRQFDVDVPFNSFTGVDINLTPANIPSHRVEKR
jgi:hypothetical protein